MSAPAVASPCRSYSVAMWIHRSLKPQHNTPYRTFNNKYKEYQQCTNNENWSPNSKRRLGHRVFQKKLIDALNDYNHRYVMNSDQTLIQQSMPPVYTIHPTGKPAVVKITWVSILIQILVQHVLAY